MRSISTVTVAAIIILVLLPGLFMAAGDCHAQTDPFTTTHISIHTDFLRNVRNIGMGGVGVSEISGYGTGYYNPASLAWTDAMTAGSSFHEYLIDIDIYDIGISGYYQPGKTFGENTPWERGLRLGWALSYWGLSMPEIRERTIYMPEGSTVSFPGIHEYYLTSSLAAAWKMGIFEVGAGGAVKYLEYKNSGLSLWAFDLGIVAAAEFETEDGRWLRPRIGFSVVNLGNGFDLPGGGTSNLIERYRIGGGFDFSPPRESRLGWKFDRKVRVLRISISYDQAFDDAGEDEYLEKDNMDAFGFEISIMELFSARFGTSDNLFLKDEAMTAGFGLGWDSGKWIVSFDYAIIGDNTAFDESVTLDNYRLLFGWRY
ncbi:MAG: hypothetical protein KOO63_01815 [Bacteroidales bacterium]|nr:hypothetical protein [Candidatus Latescibacterota bacterium]